ncbi:MAG TPA: hypothetical protein VFH54_14995 [Mycobacteriales bacterium]|jgi:hypothetical protein|nr:hypothetical protein [Mycobacteriales bacterium]HET7415317.1 hypothetical protein [Arthrobacter sp.]
MDISDDSSFIQQVCDGIIVLAEELGVSASFSVETGSATDSTGREFGTQLLLEPRDPEPAPIQVHAEPDGFVTVSVGEHARLEFPGGAKNECRAQTVGEILEVLGLVFRYGLRDEVSKRVVGATVRSVVELPGGRQSLISSVFLLHGTKHLGAERVYAPYWKGLVS